MENGGSEDNVLIYLNVRVYIRRRDYIMYLSTLRKIYCLVSPHKFLSCPSSIFSELCTRIHVVTSSVCAYTFVYNVLHILYTCVRARRIKEGHKGSTAYDIVANTSN